MSIAVWVKFPKLPIEFYDLEVLKEIGSVLGPVLRIDSYTATGSRGSYARLCIQLDTSKPLITSIKVGRLVQQVMYEGLSSLYFCCGHLGHKLESCPYSIQEYEKKKENEKTREEVAEDQN